jgi:hypothetical protein
LRSLARRARQQCWRWKCQNRALSRSGDITAETLRRPVTITQRNKPGLVLSSYEEDYQQLRTGGDSRKAHRIETMLDDLPDDAKAALAAYEAELDEP